MESVKIICPQQQTKQTWGTVAAQPEREYLNLIINNKPLIMRLFFWFGGGGVGVCSGECEISSNIHQHYLLSALSLFKKKAAQIRFRQAYSILFMESFENGEIHNGAGI